MSDAEPTLTNSPTTDPGTLRQSLLRFQVPLADPLLEARLEQYCQVLWRENQVLNLTRHLTFDVFVARDLNDVIQVSSLIRPNETVLDVGSGGGVPGVVLAILRPDLHVTLCESVAKRVRALETIVQDLGLKCTLRHQRAEELLATERFDVCIARAVGPLWKICNWFQGRWRSMDRLLAFKGMRWTEELQEARQYPSFQEVQTRVVAEYPMPGTDSLAYIIKLWAKGAPDA